MIPQFNNTLPVMESFPTLQGEGFYQGKAAWFIRLGGCDVGCVWCDVKDSWDASKHPQKTIPEIITPIKNSVGNIVVITGGEPLMYPLDNLTHALQDEGYKTHLETSGAYPLSGSWDWICFSPKKFKQPLLEVAAQAHELKVVVFHKSDFDWAEKHRQFVNPACKLYLQPEWSKHIEITPLIVDYIQQHPEWELSLQMHKYIGLP